MGGQAVQIVPLVENSPALHATQVSPAALGPVPQGHDSHSLRPDMGLTLLGGHARHTSPPTEICPAGQVSQPSPLVLVVVPGGQGEQEQA